MRSARVSARAVAADPAGRAQSRVARGRTKATGLSPRKVRLATGSLRRSFFTLGRLLALTSRQHSMVRPPGARRGARAGREREREQRVGAPPSERPAPRHPCQEGAVAFAALPRNSPRAWPRPRGGHRTPAGRTLSHPTPAPAPTRPAAGGQGGAGVRSARVGAPAPLGGLSPRARDDSAADAGRTAAPGRGDSEPAASLVQARSAPVRTSRAAAALHPAAPSPGPHSRGAAKPGRRRNERKREEGTSGRRNASVCFKLLVGASAGRACEATERHAAP